MRARIVADYDYLEQPGDIHVVDTGIIICCPGCGKKSFLPDKDMDSNETGGWSFSNIDSIRNRRGSIAALNRVHKLTASPSVWHKKRVGNPDACGWHGHLTDGEWNEVK